MNSSKRKLFLIYLCTIFSLLCVLGVSNMGQLSTPIVRYGKFVFPVSSIQGFVAALNSLSCVVMVFIDFRKGSKFAFGVMIISLMAALNPIFATHNLASLPSVVTSLVSFFTIFVIYTFYKKSSLDSLTEYITGLPNRHYYERYANQRLEGTQPFYLACIEIEDFKNINDVYGIQAGDYLLKEIAPKLKAMLGKNDMLFNITGGIFAMILDEESYPEEKLKLIIRSEEMLLPPKHGEDPSIKRICNVSLAAGVVHINQDYDKERNASGILHYAEIALADARNSKLQKIVFYDDSLQSQDLEQKEAEFLIKEALEHNWFFLVYQPQYITKGKKLRGFETLIRCKKPDGTIVSPAKFIPAAEKTNLITEIDDYVLRRAMTEFKPVLDASENKFVVSINVSAKNIARENFTQKIKQMIDETQFPAENLEIEITEYSFAESMDATIDNILTLRTLGIQIALDDFGTGYTSIAQLMKLPVNLLKIDKSLIDELETDPVMSDMVDSIIYMGHIMDCEVISEGVENESQLEILKDHKCDFIQGFVWGKPLPFEEAKALVR